MLYRKGTCLALAALLVLGGLVACGAAPAPTLPAQGGPVALAIVGKVDRELGLSKADMRARDMVTVTTSHPRFGEDDYEGLRLNDLLNEAGVQDGATVLLVTSTHGTTTEVALADVRACADCLISFCESDNLRLVMPGLPTETWVGQVVSIEVR